MLRILFTILIVLIPIRGLANEEDQNAKMIASICASGKAEGRYTVKFQGPEKVYVYILCMGTSRIVATTNSESIPFNPETSKKKTPKSDDSFNLMSTMVFSAVDGNKLTFASSTLNSDEAGGRPLSGEPNVKMEVSIADLMNSKLVGRYRSIRSLGSSIFSSPRDQAFPNLLKIADFSRDYTDDIVGIYEVKGAQIGPLRHAAPLLLDFDVILGQQRIGIADGSSVSWSLQMGMSSEHSGNIFYACSGEDNPGALGALVHIRARRIAENEIEVYYFNSQTGMWPPVRAYRIESLPFQIHPATEIVQAAP